MTTRGCHHERMDKKVDVASHQEAFDHLKAVRTELLGHYRIVRELAAERRQLIQALVDKGLSQADIGRELGVSRQAIQKMLAC